MGKDTKSHRILSHETTDGAVFIGGERGVKGTTVRRGQIDSSTGIILDAV